MGVVARLTGQYVERAPDAAELFSKGVHEATQTFEKARKAASARAAPEVQVSWPYDLEVSRPVPIDLVILKLSLGFGGHVAVACLAPG